MWIGTGSNSEIPVKMVTQFRAYESRDVSDQSTHYQTAKDILHSFVKLSQDNGRPTHTVHVSLDNKIFIMTGFAVSDIPRPCFTAPLDSLKQSRMAAVRTV
jgi:hypothetical protein